MQLPTYAYRICGIVDRVMVDASIMARDIVCDGLSTLFGLWQSELFYLHLVVSIDAMKSLIKAWINYIESFQSAIGHFALD
ncbi:hypothetical protein D3C80_1779700 [compost metagenome]